MNRAGENKAVIAMTVGLPEAWKAPAWIAEIAARDNEERGQHEAGGRYPTKSTTNERSTK